MRRLILAALLVIGTLVLTEVLDDFQLLMWVTLTALPLILLLRKNRQAAPKQALEAAVE